MWKSRAFKSLYGLNRLLNKTGIGKVGLVDHMRRWGKGFASRSLTEDGAVQIEVRGMPFFVYPQTWEFHAYLDCGYEPYTAELFKRAVKPGSRVLDIGAQFGYFSLLAAKQAAQGGQVYAFEPAAANFKLLQRNIELNGYAHSIHPIQKAVAEKRKSVRFFLYEGSDSHAMYPRPDARVKQEVSVECVTIDEELGERAVDVIKMDIEGNEPYALRGMEKTISKSANLTLFAEFAPWFLELAGFNPEDYLKQIESMGFVVRIIDEESRSLVPFSADLLARLKRSHNGYANLHCLKHARTGA